MQITGTLKVKGESKSVSDKFMKREFVVTIPDGTYPQHVSFQLTQDRCILLDNFKTGDTVTVHFNLRGREWTSPQMEIKYFNTLEAWKIDSFQPNVSTEEITAKTGKTPVNDSDLPF
jgi:hypothetical protein